jgi:hypothetical protein
MKRAGFQSYAVAVAAAAMAFLVAPLVARADGHRVPYASYAAHGGTYGYRTSYGYGHYAYGYGYPYHFYLPNVPGARYYNGYYVRFRASADPRYQYRAKRVYYPTGSTSNLGWGGNGYFGRPYGSYNYYGDYYGVWYGGRLSNYYGY